MLTASLQACLPNFFILGAPKCGTTSLYRYLGSHPDVFFPANKEPQFFCHDGLFNCGLEFYAKRFYSGADRFPCRGDATPHYLYYDKVALRILQSLPEESHRFIVILRDPVARAYSHYWDAVAQGRETLGFEEALAEEAKRIENPGLASAGTLTFHYVSAGLYARQLQRYFSQFDRNRLLILFQDDLAANARKVMQEVVEFLALSPAVLDLEGRHNTAGMPRSRLLQHLTQHPNRLRHLLGKAVPYRLKFGISRHIQRMNTRDYRYPELDTRVAAGLRKLFVDDITQLEAMTGRNLLSWKTGAQA